MSFTTARPLRYPSRAPRAVYPLRKTTLLLYNYFIKKSEKSYKQAFFCCPSMTKARFATPLSPRPQPPVGAKSPNACHSEACCGRPWNLVLAERSGGATGSPPAGGEILPPRGLLRCAQGAHCGSVISENPQNSHARFGEPLRAALTAHRAVIHYRSAASLPPLLVYHISPNGDMLCILI